MRFPLSLCVTLAFVLSVSFAAPADGIWPIVRPPDFHVKYFLGGLHATWELSITPDGGHIESHDDNSDVSGDFSVSPDELDAMYATFRTHRFERMRRSRHRLTDHGEVIEVGWNQKLVGISMTGCKPLEADRADWKVIKQSLASLVETKRKACGSLVTITADAQALRGSQIFVRGGGTIYLAVDSNPGSIRDRFWPGTYALIVSPPGYNLQFTVSAAEASMQLLMEAGKLELRPSP